MKVSIQTGTHRPHIYACALPMRTTRLTNVIIALICLLFTTTGAQAATSGYASATSGATNDDHLVVNPRTPVTPGDLGGGSTDVKTPIGEKQEDSKMATLLDTDTDGYYLIKSRADWDKFAANYDGTGNFRLAADISDSVTTMIGSTDIPFQGTFDGAGHTLTINYDFYKNKVGTDQTQIAPFRYISGAHFKNFNITGIITTEKSQNHAAGFASEAIGGDNTFDSCVSYVDIDVSLRNDDATTGGFLGYQNDTATVVFNNCAYFGRFNANGRVRGWGGFVGYGEDGAKVTINNSVFAPKSNSTIIQHNMQIYGNATFMRCNPNNLNVNIENCYYYIEGIRNVQIKQGTAITESQITNGNVFGVVRNTYESDNDGVKFYDYFVNINETKDNKPNMSLHADATRNVKLTRTFADGWNTLVLPFDLTTDEVNAAFGEQTQVAYFSNDTENTITLNLSDNDEKNIPANEPVLIKPSKTGSVNFTFTNKAIKNTNIPTTVGANGINFVGSYNSNHTVAADDYFIGNEKLWKSTGNTALKGTRAYFTVAESKAESKIFLVWGENDEPTGIESTDAASTAPASTTIYNLYGQKMGNNLNNLPSGIYIINGKKIKK